MKLPLRSLAVFTSGLLSLGACSVHAASPNPSSSSPPAAENDTAVIPGPLRSFLRMAGVSQEVTGEEVLPLLARNVYLRGYEHGTETEFLVLLNRYVEYARELESLAQPDGTIRVKGCDDAARLVQTLGYAFQQPCGQKNSYLVTSNAERAFLTIDSGFPLSALEEAMERNAAFSYAFPATTVPVLFHEHDWIGVSSFRKKGPATVLDVLLHDQNLDRLYWAMSKVDDETRSSLKKSPGLHALLTLAPGLDFYGSQISIVSGRIEVPGGSAAEHGWEDLVGASTKSPGEFTKNLLMKDRGWLAAYFDALSRVNHEQQARLTEGPRLKMLYDVYRRAGTSGSAIRGTFPRNPGLLMLFTSLRWEGKQPYVPGSLAVWNEILTQPATPELIRGWVKRASKWDSPDQLLMTLVACSVYENDAGPLQVYLTTSAIDGARAPGDRMAEGTLRLIASNFAQYHSWFVIFPEFPALNDTSIVKFVTAANAVNGIGSQTLRANAMGAFQANVGLWEIFARQQQIPSEKMNASWQDLVQPFIGINSSIQLFDASRGSLRSLLVTVKGGDGNLSQDQIIDLLAGPAQDTDAGRRVHAQLAERIRTVLDDQRLVSLDTLFGLYDGLDQMAHGAKIADEMIPLAGNLREFEMPRPVFTQSEKIAWAPGIYSSRHTELQIRTNLTKVIQSPGSGAQLEAARGQLTPFLRDTLVGLNYAYYEPPGAQALHHNPLFVRSHDFSGTSIESYGTTWGAPVLIGIGVTAGGGAYLIGSLADLPYALAVTEEDFIAPENVQALIWSAEAPALLVSATEPRWWGVTPSEQHAAALYQRAGEELLVDSAGNEELRGKVEQILTDAMTPRRLEMTEGAMQKAASISALLPNITPAEKFYLAAEFRTEYPAEAAQWGAAGRELDELAKKDAAATDPKRISRDFGVPHPTLAQTNACAILNVKPFPAFGGDPYRLLGESWESSNLYWARISDEMGYSPTMLNVLVPELTRHMVAKIFATDLEDWPALLRAMEETGKEFEAGRITVAANSNAAMGNFQNGR